MLMMMGMMVLMAVLVIAIVVANISYRYWNHSINTVNACLALFKFVGMAFLLTGIGLALATIIRVLRCQSQRLWDILT